MTTESCQRSLPTGDSRTDMSGAHGPGSTHSESYTPMAAKGRLAAWRRLPVRAPVGCAVLLSALATSLLLSSCGGQDGHRPSDPTDAGAAAAQPPVERNNASRPPLVAPAASQVGASGEARADS